MNLVGKIFVVLILVLSVLYMALAGMVFATHKNWVQIITDNTLNAQGVPVGLEPRLVYEKNRYENLNAKHEALQKQNIAESQAMEQRLQSLQQSLATATRARDDATIAQNELVAQQRELSAQLATSQQELGARLAESDKLRDEINKTREDRDGLFDQLVAATDVQHQTEIQRDRLEATTVELVAQMAKAKDVLSKLGGGATIDTPVDNIPPKVDGVVVASADDGRVEISLGSDDGLSRGHELIVFRQAAGANKFVGKIQVTRVWPDRSVARVLPEFKKAPIERDDRVATRLN